MTHPNKRKGNNYERELVKEALKLGIDAERAFASDGRSLGETENVDVKIAGFNIQAKRRKKIADYLLPGENVDVQVFRQDYGESLALMRYSLFLKLLKDAECDDDTDGDT